MDHSVDGIKNIHQDTFIISKNGRKRKNETIKGWELLIQWEHSLMTWESMNDVKQCYPLQLYECSHQAQISQETAFSWWVPHVMKKRNKIISKVKSKYWTHTHKYGVRIPKSVKETKLLDK